MENSEGRTCIDDLPNLVLTKIFKGLLNHERETVAQVCEKWHDIINFEVGFRRFIGNGVDFNFPGHKSARWSPIDVLDQEGIHTCIFGNVEPSEKTNEKSFIVPELVNEISFYGSLSTRQFQQIMDPVHWLSTLKMHLIIFATVSFDNDYRLQLPCLRHFWILYTHPVLDLSFPFSNGDSGPLAKEVIHINLIKFLDGCFLRRIRTFAFVGPYFLDKVENLLEAVRLFVVKHSRSLHELVMSFPYEWNVQPLTKFGRVNKVSTENTKENRQKWDWGNVQLTRLVITCPATVVPPIVATTDVSDMDIGGSFWTEKSTNFLWDALLEKQSRLMVLQYLNKYEDWPFPQTIVSNNACSLKALSLCVNSKLHVDCKVIACCESLTRLNLEGNFFYHVNELTGNNSCEEDGIGQVCNAHCLPESIEDLCLSKLVISDSELEAVFDPNTMKFPNLKRIQLYQITKGLPRFGLTTIAVQHLFDRNTLSVSFWQALNAPSFSGAMEKLHKAIDRDVMTLMKVLELCDSADGVHEDLQFATLDDCHIQRNKT